MTRDSIAKKLTTVLAVTALTLLATVATDRLVGLFKNGSAEPEGIIFTPNSQAIYDTVDFSFRSSINSLGFRDHEFSLAKSAKYRVVAIGDSYTYGWGVNVEDSWPKILEGDLRRDGLDVEIANLGSPGASPLKYAEIAEKAIPLLKPDLVVVAVLQGDDLEQLKPEQPVAENSGIRSQATASIVRRIAHRLYPNLLHLVNDMERKDRPYRVTDEWKHEAQEILSRFTATEMKRYQGLHPTIRTAFESGKLNPPLIQSAIERPNYWLDTFDPDRPEVKNLIDEMARQLGRIKKVANEYGADVVVVSVPMGIYVNNEDFKVRKQYGFVLNKNMLVSDSEDSEIRTAAESAGLPFLTVTEQFRKNKDAPFFFRLDTHLDSAGQHFYADRLAPTVENELRTLRDGTSLVRRM
jgi:lysophospholipase L1-like esterase